MRGRVGGRAGFLRKNLQSETGASDRIELRVVERRPIWGEGSEVTRQTEHLHQVINPFDNRVLVERKIEERVTGEPTEATD